MTTTDELKQQICEIGKRAWTREFVAACDGNISARLDEDRVLCTPTMTCKGFMTPDSLCIVDMDGTQIEGQNRPTSEIKLHLSIYRQRSDVRSVFPLASPSRDGICGYWATDSQPCSGRTGDISGQCFHRPLCDSRLGRVRSLHRPVCCIEQRGFTGQSRGSDLPPFG